MDSPVDLFLGGAETVNEALSDPRVGRAWEQPCVLEEQTVGGLAAHLARGGVWLVGDYLAAAVPQRAVDFDSAGAYFAAFAEEAGPEAHRAIRERGAAGAAAGWKNVCDQVSQRLGPLRDELAATSPDRLVSVIAGKVMSLGEYLVTRVVEQAVHLDDLARSIAVQPWSLPDGHEALALAVGVDIVRLRRGTPAALRALYRQGFAEAALPAL